MKILSYKSLIILTIILIVLYFINLKFFNEKLNYQNQSSNIEESKLPNSNIIENIKYSSKDLKGNEYIILAKEGEIDLNNEDIIFLKKVTSYIKLAKNNEEVKITSDFGKYNSINYDTIFSKNVRIYYLDNKIEGEYLDFSMIKNKLIVSKNVIYTNTENILKADVIELDTISKDTKIFMHNSKEKVNIESRN